MSEQSSTQRKALTFKDIANTIQFGWFIGHALTLISGALYVLTYRSGGRANSFFYSLLFLSDAATFGILLFQEYTTRSLNLAPLALASNESAQYLVVALLFLLVLPKTLFATVPFIVFALFHCLSYTNNTLFGVFGVPSTSKLSVAIVNFIQKYHNKSLYVAATFEFLILVWYVLGAFLWRKGYWIGLAFYTVFFKLRYEKSIVTRTVVKSWEVKIDGVVSHPSVPVQLKSGWLQFKQAIKQFGGKPVLASTAPTPAAKSQ